MVFRRDLYGLFSDKRFVTSSARLELRGTTGDVRTDIDAAVLDRKSGTLGLFELKSQDPFAQSAAELHRQRANILFANRQIAGIADWINRHGSDEILKRLDAKTVKTFRVHKAFHLVLGRYLVHFNDGAAPDKRAAWATWPQLLRVLETPVRREPDRIAPWSTVSCRGTRTDVTVTPVPRDPTRSVINHCLSVARLLPGGTFVNYQLAVLGSNTQERKRNPSDSLGSESEGLFESQRDRRTLGRPTTRRSVRTTVVDRRRHRRADLDLVAGHG